MKNCVLYQEDATTKYVKEESQGTAK